MPDIALKIVRRGDQPPWDDLTDPERYIAAGASWQVAIVERGMTSGKPAVLLRLDPVPGADGPVIIFETSMAAWITVTAAMRGAFPEQFADGPFHT